MPSKANHSASKRTLYLFAKLIAQIKGENLQELMKGINRIMMKEARLEDGKRLRTDITVVETDIHYPTNNELMWDCIKTAHRFLKKLEERRCLKKVRNYQRQAKKSRLKINNSKRGDKRKGLFVKQLKLLKSSINQVKKAVSEATE